MLKEMEKAGMQADHKVHQHCTILQARATASSYFRCSWAIALALSAASITAQVLDKVGPHCSRMPAIGRIVLQVRWMQWC